MSISITEGTVTLDGRLDGRNLLISESFSQIQWLLHVRGIWHRVTIFDGWRYGKNNALKLIHAAVAPEELIAFLYQQDGANAVFFVNGCGGAIRKLCQTNLKINNPTGRNLVLQIQLQYPLLTKICVKSIIGKAISTSMYSASEKLLFLNKFHKDPEVEKWMFCPLYLKKVVDEVLGVLSSYNWLHSLKILVLSNNSLTTLQNFSFLVPSAPNIKVIDLQNNIIPELSSLNRLRGLQLHELILDGNPLCELYEEESKYVDEVRDIFPTITKLDGVTLPPKGFPVHLRNFLCSPFGESFVEQFISHYFKLYDGWSGRKTRLNLIGTYSKEAFFSFSAVPLPANNGLPLAAQPMGRLNKYFPESRNLLKMSDYIKNHKYLIHDRENIVKFLSDLPLTEHDRGSICVDMPHFTDAFATLTVRGVYRELGALDNSLYSFSRVFVLWRNCSTFFITNDMLFITNVTEHQAEVSSKSLPPLSANPFNETEVQANLDDENYDIKQNMVEELAKATEMNLKWSRKCLIESEWDFQEALNIFMKLYGQGIIPYEAFKS